MCQDSEELSVRGARVPEKNPAAESNAYERKNIPGRQMTSPVPSMNNETGARNRPIRVGHLSVCVRYKFTAIQFPAA